MTLEPIQEVHRRALLGAKTDAEGYVSSHQHFSHAHDLGWPFPIWAQAGNTPFYDLMARLQVDGPSNAWQRLQKSLAWEKDVWKEGGYRKYYAEGKRGTTLQGGGTCGGLGIDCEFYESSLLPGIVVYGFLGLDARLGNALAINPRLPAACPEMAVTDVLYHNTLLDIRASQRSVEVTCKSRPLDPIHLVLPGMWKRVGTDEEAADFDALTAGSHRFEYTRWTSPPTNACRRRSD